MAILMFRRTKLDSFKLKDLYQERSLEEVAQDTALRDIKSADEEYRRRWERASRPGASEGQKQVDAARMAESQRSKGRAQRHLRQAITRTIVLDSLVDVIRLKRDLKRRGVWKRINSLDPDDLNKQVTRIASLTKNSDNKLEAIINVLEVDEDEAEFNLGSGYEQALHDIEEEAKRRASDLEGDDR